MRSAKLRVLTTLSLALVVAAATGGAQPSRPRVRRPAGGAGGKELIVRAQRIDRGQAPTDMALTLASGRKVEISRKDVAKASRSAGGFLVTVKVTKVERAALSSTLWRATTLSGRQITLSRSDVASALALPPGPPPGPTPVPSGRGGGPAARIMSVPDATGVVTPVAGSIGLDQPVLVIAGRYKPTDGEGSKFETFFVENPDGQELTTAQQIADLFNVTVNAYYTKATKSKTSFFFKGQDGICNFGYEYDGKADKKEVMTREVDDALKFAEQQDPSIFDQFQRVVVVVNRSRRNRSTWASTVALLRQGKLRRISAAVLDPRSTKERGTPTVCHELGHQLGLPDLYNEDAGKEGQKRYVHRWGLMGSDCGQHFCAYSRFNSNWIENPAQRVLTLVPSVATPLDQNITVGFPYNTAGHPELIRVQMTASLLNAPFETLGGQDPMEGFYISARDPRAGDDLDARLGDPPLKADGTRKWSVHKPGVVIFRHSDRSFSQQGWRAPLRLRHRDPNDDYNNLAQGAHRPSDTFTDDSGLKVKVLQRHGNDGYDINVKWEPPPAPDMVTTDLWLDSRHNDYGTLESPGTYGDPIKHRLRIRWKDNGPYLPKTPLPPELQLLSHRLYFKVKNVGSAAAQNIPGTVLILGPQVPMTPESDSLEALAQYATKTLNFSIPQLNAGQEVTQYVTFTPTGPFLAVVGIHPHAQESIWGWRNNYYQEAIIAMELPSGSPFKPLDISLEAINPNQTSHVFLFSTSLPIPIPNGWTITHYDNWKSLVAAGQKLKFRFRAEPPLPGTLAKPSALGVVNVTAWMDYRDCFIPVMTVPYHYKLVTGTHLTLQAKNPDKPQLSGRLKKLENGNATDGLAGERVFVDVWGDDGSDVELEATTGSGGYYQTTFTPTTGVQYAAVARYPGSEHYGSSQSGQVTYGVNEGNTAPPTDPTGPAEPGKLPPMKLPAIRSLEHRRIKAVRGGPTSGLVITLSGRAPRGGATIALTSSNPKLVPLPAKATVLPGQTQVTVPFQAGASRIPTNVILVARLGRSAKRVSVRLGGKFFPPPAVDPVKPPTRPTWPPPRDPKRPPPTDTKKPPVDPKKPPVDPKKPPRPPKVSAAYVVYLKSGQVIKASKVVRLPLTGDYLVTPVGGKPIRVKRASISRLVRGSSSR